MAEWRVLSLKDASQWSELIESCSEADIHFIPEYLKAFEGRIGGQAFLFVFDDKENDNFLLYPFFKRRINDLDLFASCEDEYFDIISPWYFGGPLLHSEKNRIQVINNFLASFQTFANQNNIITEFTRIYPLFNTSKDFIELSHANYRYDISYIDLEQSEETIWNNFKKSNRNSINAAKRKGVKIDFSISEDAVNTFFELYHESMKRINADEFYFFPNEFFKKIIRYLKENFTIVTATYNEIPISSSIFLFKFGTIHYWLSANNYTYRNIYANNLLLHESIQWAKKNNNQKFVLMGGTNEGLRNFKESFTNTKMAFYTLNRTFNQEIYEDLNKIRSNSNESSNKSSFFPVYRS